MTAEQTSPGGKDATNVAYWYTGEERKNMMGVDGYMVSCKGDQLRFSLLPGAGTVNLSGKIVPGNKQIKVTGSFNYVCPGLSACDFGEAPQ